VPTYYSAVRLNFDVSNCRLPHRLVLVSGNVRTNFDFTAALFVFELGARTGQTDRQTDGRSGKISNAGCGLLGRPHIRSVWQVQVRQSAAGRIAMKEPRNARATRSVTSCKLRRMQWSEHLARYVVHCIDRPYHVEIEYQ